MCRGLIALATSASPPCWFRHMNTPTFRMTVRRLTKSRVPHSDGVTGVNTLRPRQNGRHFPDDIFKCIFLNENAWISTKISVKFVPKGQINKIPSLVQIMAWRRPGDKQLSEAMMVSLLTHICVTRPQWVKASHFTRLSTLCSQA